MIPRSREPLDTTVAIETPEHVRFRYPVAGPAKRSLAYGIDFVIRATIVVAVAFVAQIGGLRAGESLEQASNGVLLVVVFVVEWVYYVLFEAVWSGRTPGKRILSLRVVTVGGHPLRFGDSVLRNLVRAADILPFAYAIGLVVMGRDAKFRRLGDLVAGTLVVHTRAATLAAPLQLTPPPTHAELGALPQRLPLSGDELDAIELFLRRARTLSPPRAAELAEMVAPIFARRIGIRYADATRFLGVLHHRAHRANQATGAS